MALLNTLSLAALRGVSYVALGRRHWFPGALETTASSSVELRSFTQCPELSHSTPSWNKLRQVTGLQSNGPQTLLTHRVRITKSVPPTQQQTHSLNGAVCPLRRKEGPTWHTAPPGWRERTSPVFTRDTEHTVRRWAGLD